MKPAMNKPIKFDRHAKRRMKWRRISEDEVFSVIDGPDKTEESVMGRVNCYKRVGQRYLKVTFREFPDEIRIISAVDKGVAQ